MSDFIINNLLSQNSLSLTDTLVRLVISLIIGGTVYMAYNMSSTKVNYNGSFGYSLIAMTIITTAIISVISSNIALSLGMVGALSIIRFRTAVKDPKDAMFIFWSIMVGICCGVAQYTIALVSTVVLFVVFLLTKAIREDKRYILIVRCAMNSVEQVKPLIYKYYPNCRLSVQNTSKEYVEFIYELKSSLVLNNEEFIQEIYACDGVECANFVLQEDASHA